MRRFGVATILLWLLLASPAAAEQTTLFDLGPGTRAEAIVAGPDGNLWFGGVNYAGGFHNVVGWFSTTGEVREFSLPPRDSQFLGIGGVAIGPDGNLWFTERNAGRIGRVTPFGEVTEIPVPIDGTHPDAITTGPDGDLWFTDGVANVIARFDPRSEEFTQFALPPGADASGIVTGPDGALWFTEKGRGRIGRFTLDGAGSGYDVPAVSHPKAIVIGPDGDFWFSDEAAPRVGRLGVGGEFQLFPVPAQGGTEELSRGPGGRVWYGNGTEIGSVSPTGEVEPPACVTPQCDLPVTALAPGPEGDLWFATGVREVEGGGGAHILELFLPGIVGRFFPPPLLSLGPRLGRTRGHYTTIRLACDGGLGEADCEGQLTLYGKVPRSFSRRDRVETILLGQRGFRLAAGSSRRLAVTVSRRGLGLLARLGRLHAHAVARLADNREIRQRFILRR